MNPSILKKLFIIGQPISPIYSLLMKLRRAAYLNDFLQSKRLEGFTISIGNITLGGTGKSPHVIEIANFFKKKGEKVAILSRGYGGKAGKGPIVVNDSQGKIITPCKICGDEPYMFAQKLKNVPVIVGADRYRSGVLAQKEFNTTVFILDDGFQHLKLKRELDIVLISATSLFGNKKVFPGGELREDIRALSNASAIIITKTNEVSSLKIQEIKTLLRKIVHKKPIFLSSYKAKSIYLPIKCKNLKIKENEYNAFVFCALADPNSFYNLLKQNGIKIAGFMEFRDHYFYKSKDLEKIYKAAQKSKAKLILTTEKDLAKINLFKWKDIDPSGNLGVLILSTQIETSFWAFLEHSFLKYKTQRHGN